MGKITFVEQASDPTTPATDQVALYVKTDGGFYQINDAGATAALAGGAAAPPVASLSAAGGVVTNGAVSFANSNAMSFGMAGSTVTMALSSVRMFDNQGGNHAHANSAATNSAAPNVSFQRFSVPFGISATRLDYLAHLSISGSTNFSSTMRVMLYTMGGSTANSVSSTFGTASGANADYANQSGTRWRSVALGTWNMTPGEYCIGFVHSLNGPSGTTGSVTIYGESNIPMLPNPGGAAVTDYFCEGIYSVASNLPPGTIELSEINGSHAAAGAQPYFRLIGTF